jgi:hypothetical protein
MCKTLHQLGAEASLSAEDAVKRTPRHVAAFNGVEAAYKYCTSSAPARGYRPRMQSSAHQRTWQHSHRPRGLPASAARARRRREAVG